MATFAEIMAKQDILVKSPDGKIKAHFRNGQITDIAFRPHTYENYTDLALASQLEHFSKLVAVARRRGRRMALKEALDNGWEPEPRRPESAREQAVAERQEHLDVKVQTAYIKVHITGGHTWQVRIKPGTTKEVSEEAFLRDLSQASKLAVAKLRATMDQIRHEEIGPSFILRGLRGLGQAD